MHNKISHYLIAFVLITSALIGYFFFSGDDSLPAQEDCSEPCEKMPATELVSSSITGANKAQPETEETILKEKDHQSKRKKRPASELYEKYMPPDASWPDGFPDMIAELWAAYQENPTGLTAYRLWNGARICDFYFVASTEDSAVQLEETAQNEMARGGSNGDVLRLTEFQKSIFKVCSDTGKRLPITNAYRFLEEAAERGLPRAKAMMAVTTPPGYFSWSDGKKAEYATKIGKLLSEARAECEPYAFNVYSWPDRPDMPRLWTSSEPPFSNNPQISEYANALALGMIYVNNYEGLSKHIKENYSRLERLRESMHLHEIEQAEIQGRELYKKYCQ